MYVKYKGIGPSTVDMLGYHWQQFNHRMGLKESHLFSKDAEVNLLFELRFLRPSTSAPFHVHEADEL